LKNLAIIRISLYAYFFLCVVPLSPGQEIVAIAEINTVTNSVTQTLPFDRPILLKYLTKDLVQVEYIGLVTIRKKDVQLYYNELLSSPGQFLAHQSGDYPNEQLTISQVVNSAGSNRFQLNIFIPPLAPNKFYDISLLRRPSDAEAEMYLELFQIYFDAGDVINESFTHKLREINEVKKPFSHVIMDGPNEGELEVEPLINLYNSKLKAHYTALARTHNDMAAGNLLKARIRDVIRSVKPAAAGEEDFLIFGQSLRLSTTSMNFDTRSKFAITPDFGYVYYGYQNDFQGLAPYLGAQIEFRYYDKDIPFRLIQHKTWLHYLSFTTGITLTSLEKEGKREDFFSNKSMIAGLGFRLSNAIRLTGGGIMYYRQDPNPAIDHRKLSITPFFGVSIDLRLKSIMGDLTDLVPSGSK